MDGTGINAGYFAGMGWLALLFVLAVSAVCIFIDVQAYLADPRRKEYNEAWFAQFEAYMRAEYKRNPELAWRTDCFHSHFDSSYRH